MSAVDLADLRISTVDDQFEQRSFIGHNGVSYAVHAAPTQIQIDF